MRTFTIASAVLVALITAACQATPRAATDGGDPTTPGARFNPETCCCEVVDLDCWTPPPCPKTYVDGSLSMLPNLGLGLGGGWVFAENHNDTFSVEAHAVFQFIDDKTFADDGNPEAGDWAQLRVGFKASSDPKARRHVTKRLGAVVIDAAGDPNIIQRSGTYYGVYAGIGFETDISPSWSVGPELSVSLVTRDDEFDLARPIPQIGWHAIWWPGRDRQGACLKRPPLGELYVGATATVGPGLGGGLEAGQVFARTSLATWSVEMLAAFQDGGDILAFEDDGEWAQIRGGAKATFQPCHCGHWTARAGVVWFRSTAANEFLDETGDYIGGYIAGGYEWDIGRRFSTGPELALLGVARESSSDFELVPQLNWHFLLKL